MATNILVNSPGYKSELFTSNEFKINKIAKMLAGYDELTWKKLKRNRKLTYIRAGSTLFFSWDLFVKQMKEFKGEVK